MARGDELLISSKYLKEIRSLNPASEIKFAFNMLIEQWRFFTALILEFRKALKEQADKDKEREFVYRSVPGIGLITSRTLANELEDLSRFKNVRALLSYTDSTPRGYSAGEHIRRGHISRQGEARIRWLFVEAAWRAKSKDIALKEAFHRIAKASSKKRDIVAMAHKLIGRIHACFRTEKEYVIGTYA